MASRKTKGISQCRVFEQRLLQPLQEVYGRRKKFWEEREGKTTPFPDVPQGLLVSMDILPLSRTKTSKNTRV